MISAVILQMWCVAGLLGIAILAIALSRSKMSTVVVYSATLAICVAALLGSTYWLLGGKANASEVALPIGLPWLGAHFRLDVLASFFLVVVNLGGASASLYGLGYGDHDPAPHRVLPFFPRVSGRHESGGAGGRCVFLPALLGIHVACFLGARHGASQ
jgi:hydrogenase-4 component B